MILLLYISEFVSQVRLVSGCFVRTKTLIILLLQHSLQSLITLLRLAETCRNSQSCLSQLSIVSRTSRLSNTTRVILLILLQQDSLQLLITLSSKAYRNLTMQFVMVRYSP